MNSDTSTPAAAASCLKFKGEGEATLLIIKGDPIGAIKLLRDRNPWLDLMTAKKIAERLRDGGPRFTMAEILTDRLAYSLALEYYRGKLSTLDLDARTAQAMEEAAARENARRMFMGTAGDLADGILKTLSE